MESNPFLQELADANDTTIERILGMFINGHRACEAAMMDADQSALAHRSNPDHGLRRDTVLAECSPGDAIETHAARASRIARKASEAFGQMGDDCMAVDTAAHLVEKAVAHDAIEFKLPRRNCTEGCALRHALSILEICHRRLYKVGISTDPAYRWANPEYGYQHTRDKCGVLFRKMDVLFASTSKQAIGMLEATLISLSRSRPWPCVNVAPGGESKIEAPIYFAYVVH